MYFYFSFFRKVFCFCTDKYYFLYHPSYSSVLFVLVYQIHFSRSSILFSAQKRKPYNVGLRFCGNFFELLFYGDGNDLFLAAGFDGDLCGSLFFCCDHTFGGYCCYVFV